MKLLLNTKCAQTLDSTSIESPIGVLSITGCSHGLHRLSRLEQSFEPNPRIKVQITDEESKSTNKWINDCIEWLAIYFQSIGPTTGSDFLLKTPPFCPNVTQSQFYPKIWSTLMNETKFGQTISYSELAVRSVGTSSASRAVGGAMKNNPFVLMVPCHRVIKKDGNPGHYSAGGVDVKQWLLAFEKDSTQNSI